MSPNYSRERLADLLIDPREDLNFEIKSWLDLRGDNNAKATFAKAAIALANHGGGFIALGLAETPDGVVEAPHRPATLDAYNQDYINGIVQNYADPAFHCAVHILADPAGDHFPLIVIPGGHKVPVRARRAGPNGNIVELNATYIRKPGPKSEIPQSAREWDDLLARCLNNRRDEIMDQIRDLIIGVVPQPAEESEQSRLDNWLDAGIARWNKLIESTAQSSGPSCPHGQYQFAYQIDAAIETVEPSKFRTILQTSVVQHTGWPPFWYPTREGIEPYLFDGVVECWLGNDPRADLSDIEPAYSDFWRISPDGQALLLRGYQEDGKEVKEGAQPGTLFDMMLPVWRVGETLLHAESLSSNLVGGPAKIDFVARYTGLAGRALGSISGRRLVWSNQVARQDAITLRTQVDSASIRPNLPEIVQPLLAPLYGLFDFADLPMDLVAEELSRMRATKF